MLQQIRPYCGIVVYLLLVSYGGSISRQTLCDMYYSVAYTAKVLNASAGLWNQKEGHYHSQEEALIQLATLQQTQEEDHHNEQQSSTEVPQQKLKFFNHLEQAGVEEFSIGKTNFPATFFQPDPFLSITSPPPRA